GHVTGVQTCALPISFLLIHNPAPACTTRAALSGWSRPSGATTSGTPAARALITVPCPPWVSTAEQDGSTSAWRTQRRTSTLAGARIVAGSTAGPVVTSPRTGSRPNASAARCSNSSSWLITVLLRLARTGGRPPGSSQVPVLTSSS